MKKTTSSDIRDGHTWFRTYLSGEVKISGLYRSFKCLKV